MRQKTNRKAEIMQAIALEIELRKGRDADEAHEPVNIPHLAEVLGCLLHPQRR